MKIKREVVILMLGALGLLCGWVLIVYRAEIALAVLGCERQSVPDEFTLASGICVETSPAERAIVQILGMTLSVGGAVAVLVGALRYRRVPHP